jgi:DNA repair protein RadA/Sms
MPGSIVLVGGDPGMGKSTLMLQLAAYAGSLSAERPCLYVTGEESLHQIKQRAERLAISANGIVVASETSVERIAALIEHSAPSLVVVDSVQTITTDVLESSAGSVAQVRECTSLLTRIAKRSGIPIIIIGHVTKDGMIAGPKVLEHMVDAVLQFEGEGTYSYRVLRALKNRYGSTNELGVFDMTSTGLREVHNPSEVLLSNRNANEPGTAVVAVIEGTRPLLIEVQALVSPTGFSMPQRVSTGYDAKRLQMILAVLEKRGGVQVRQSDVFVNVAGGIAVQDPAIDLGVAVAITSSIMDKPIPNGVAFVGELGLTGEVRRVAYLEQRVSEAVRLGLDQIYAPKSGEGKVANVVPVERLSPVLAALFG